MSKATRRQFLKATGVSVATLMNLRSVRTYAANERVAWAVIGCGNQGRSFCKGADWLCDVDSSRLQSRMQETGLSASATTSDMRRILDNKSIDAVVIATPDHWHVPAAIAASEAGKHVYLEKPAAHNFRELQILRKTFEKNGTVFQHGTHSRSDEYIVGVLELIRKGEIGEVLAAKAWNIQKRKDIGRLTPSEAPSSVDYDAWVGPAEMVPFQANRFHYDWRWWYNFGSGDIGNDGAHEIDIARWGLGVQGLPTRIAGVGGKYFFDDDQEFADTATTTFEWSGQDTSQKKRKQLIFEMRLWSTNYPYNVDSGVEFYGTKGQLFVSKRRKLQVLDERNQRRDIAIPEVAVSGTHLENFLDAIRNPATKTRADMNEAYQTTALLTLANVNLRLGREFSFDPAEESVGSDAEANTLLGRSYRKDGHWAIPR